MYKLATKYPYPKWYQKVFPYLDVASKLGLGSFIAWSLLKDKKKPAVPKAIIIDHLIHNNLPKIASFSRIWKKQILPEAIALGIGVGAADLASGLILRKLDKMQQKKETLISPIKQKKARKLTRELIKQALAMQLDYF